MARFLGFAYKFVVSSVFRKNDDDCGCGFIKPDGAVCGMDTIAGNGLPTCMNHAEAYGNATDVILLEPTGDNSLGKYHWEVVEKLPGMTRYYL